MLNRAFIVQNCLRYKLAKWATGDIDIETVSRSEDFIEHCNSLADQWLGLVISLVSERCVAGVGRDMTERSSLRAEVCMYAILLYAC